MSGFASRIVHSRLAGVTRLLIHSGLLVADVYGQGLGSLSGTITDSVRPDNSLGDRDGNCGNRLRTLCHHRPCAHSNDVDQSIRFDADQIGAKRRKALSV
jgi:hypothetical protein